MIDLDNFKPIPGYEDLYLVSENGEIYSKKRNKLLKLIKDRFGYLRVTLCKHGKPKHFFIHRLVSMTFLNNSNNLPQINHIDGDKSNNRIENLEWCTASQNLKHAYDHGLKENVRAAARNIGKIYGKINVKFATEANIRHLTPELKELFDDIFIFKLKQKDICQKYNLKQVYVSRIKNKRTLKTAISEYFSNNPDIVYQPKFNNKVKKISLKEKIQNLISKYTGALDEQQ